MTYSHSRQSAPLTCADTRRTPARLAQRTVVTNPGFDWSLDNHNSVVLARSGAGKSYLVKLEVLRNLYDGVHVAVVDPEDEYTRLARAVGGTAVQLGAPGVRFNPLDPATWDTPAPLLVTSPPPWPPPTTRPPRPSPPG